MKTFLLPRVRVAIRLWFRAETKRARISSRLISSIEKIPRHAKIAIMKIFAVALVIMFGFVVSQSAEADFIGHGGMVRSVDVSSDGTKVITASFDYTARVWRFGDQTELAVLNRHEGPVTGAVFSPDGQRAVTTSDDHTAIIWDMQTYKPLHRLLGHTHKVMAAAFSTDGARFATGAWDKTIRIWDVASGTLLQEITTQAPVNAVVFAANDTKLVSGGHHPTIQIWDVETGAPSGKLEGHKMGITAIRLSPDGVHLMSASIDKTLKIWDMTSERERRSIDIRDTQVYDVRYSPDGARALTAGKDGYVVEWDLSRGTPIHEIPAHERIAWSAAYTPDGRFAVSASSDEQARVWHVATGDRIGLTALADNTPKPWLQSDHPGAKHYTKCAKCHALTADGPARSGPHFAGLFGRQAGGVHDYHYSEALIGVNFAWDETTLFRLFDEGPDKMLPGTKMPVQRLTDANELNDLIAYLRILTKGGD
jgi:cytochrome c